MLLTNQSILFIEANTTMKTDQGGERNARRQSLPAWGGMGPVFLSALVYPGIGQMVQRRWVPGVMYAVLFSGVFGWLTIRFVLMIVQLWATADFSKPTVDAPSLGAIGWPFLLSLLVWLASLIDTAIGNRLPGSGARR